jgi:hypothetical protein
MGFMSRTDIINGHVGWGTKWTEPTKARKYQEVLGALFDSHDFQGNPVWGGGYVAGATEFINNYSWNYSVAYNWQTLNSRRTRGGPLTINRPGYEFFNYIDTDGKAKLFYYLEKYGYFTESGSYNWFVSPGVEWKPVSNVMFSVGPQYERVHEDAQYVTTLSDVPVAATYDQAYVFGVLEQHTVSANIRLNCAFTPTLSLQTFVQPLVSSGKYGSYKTLSRPRSYSFTPYDYEAHPLYGEDDDHPDPNFNVRSLRGNAVLRWEFLPGSTMFLVWTQQREDSEDDGTFRLGRAYRRLFDAQASNIFLAKVTYYLTR